MNVSSARPQVTVLGMDGKSTSQLKLPSVFLTPIRTDLVQEVHTNMAKNKRQPYGVLSRHGPGSRSAGHQHSAHSWGTGRAVSRIPRVGGSGTHRSGQGAIGNMCRGGHMFAPTKVWRRWHRHANKKQRRYATASALAASAIPSLVSARGHRVEKTLELPLVVDTAAEKISKTKEAVELLKAVGAYKDIVRVKKANNLRAGRGKMRGRRHKQRKGPLVVYDEDEGIVRAFRNIPGVELCQVSRLNLLQLAPGAHCGRFVIWTKDAFEKLDQVFGTFTEQSTQKKGFVLPRYNILTNADLGRIINSTEVQEVLRPAKENNGTRTIQKKNPFKANNVDELLKLNPYAQEMMA